jgi:hypothetical protein
MEPMADTETNTTAPPIAPAEPEPLPPSPDRSRVPLTFAIGLAIVFLVAGGVVLLSRATQPKQIAAAQKLPYGPAEQAYAPQIQFQNLRLAQSSNLLNQQFTYVAGTLINKGPRTIRALEVVVEFHDPFKQVVLRDDNRLIEMTDPPLGAGKQQDFQITVEQGVPSEWNQQYPSIRVTGLVLE